MSQFENLRVGLLKSDKQCFPFVATDKTTSTTVTLTAAELAGGLILCAPSAAATYTLPSAADIIAHLDMQPGDAFDFMIKNTSGANAIGTMNTGTGMTGSGTVTVAANVTRRYICLCTGVSAVTLYGIGTLAA